MPDMHKSNIEKIYRDGKVVAYDLQTIFPAKFMSSLLIMKDGIDSMSFQRSVNDYIEAVDIRMAQFHKIMMENANDMILKILTEESIDNKVDELKESRENFVNRFRKSSIVTKKLNDIAGKMLEELGDDNISKSVLKNILSKINDENQEVKEEAEKYHPDNYNNSTSTSTNYKMSFSDGTVVKKDDEEELDELDELDEENNEDE